MKKESGRRRERSGRRQEEVRRHGRGQDETDVELKEFRCERLKRSFIQQFVDAVADLPQRQSVLLSVPVQLGQIVAVGKMVENVIDARVRARGQVLLDQGVKQVPALQQELGENIPVKGVLHLVEGHRCHGRLVHLLLEALHRVQLVGAELVVPVQDADLQGDLDDVLDDLVGLFLALGELAAGLVELVQDLTAGVVRQHVGHHHGRHLAQYLFLRLHCQGAGVKALLSCEGKEERFIQN